MALTKVTGQVINDSTGLVVGVTTVGGGLSATDGFFSGIVTAVGNASFSGNVSVGGTLTYEDVTNIDAVGLVTARNGVVVGSGITLSKDGDIFATGVTTATTFSGSGASLTNLNASNLASGTVPTARLGSGTASSSTFLRGDSTFAAVTSTTINNNANNRVITGSDTANTLNGEANLQFDGTNIGVGVAPSGVASYSTIHLKGQTSGNGGAIRLTDYGDTPDSDDFTIYKNSAAGYLRVNGTDPLIAYLNGADRLKIDSDGNVTKPTHCSVAVRMSSNTSWPGNNGFDTDTGRLEFDTELWDIGSNFNTSNYTFTAPVAGRYLMNYLIQVESYTGFQWIYAYPIVNDSETTTTARGIAIADFGPGDSNSASATYWAYSHSLVANLQANDAVKFKVRGLITSATIKGTTESQWNIDLLG